MNVEIGTDSEAPIFLFWEYLFQIFGILSLQCTHREPLLLSSLHPLGRGPPLGCRRDSKSGFPYSKPMRNNLSHTAPLWATPHPSGPHRTPLSHTAPLWATSHPSEPHRNPLSHKAPLWATPHHVLPHCNHGLDNDKTFFPDFCFFVLFSMKSLTTFHDCFQMFRAADMMKEAKFYQKFGRSKNWPKVSGFFLVFFHL